MSRTGRGPGRPPGGAGSPGEAAPGAAFPLAAAGLGAGLLALGIGAGEGVGKGAYLDGPPTGHTGGFDEPTCRACHFDRELNPSGGDLRLEGVPGRYVADSVYEVSVVLTHDEMARAGFQLAARWLKGERRGCSAGALEPAGGGAEAAAVSDSAGGAGGGCEVVYVHHAEAGTRPGEDGVARWKVRWRPPDGPDGPVAFHAAANAANDDASEFGDRIYATKAVSRPRE